MDTINYRVNWENASVANVKMDLEDYRISPDVQMIAILFYLFLCVCVCVPHARNVELRDGVCSMRLST